MAEAHRDEIAKLEALYASNPEGRVFTHLAEAYRKAGELELAGQVLEQGLQRHPDSVSGFIVLGRVHLDRGDREQAVQAIRRALDLDSGNLVAHRLLGELALDQDAPADALHHFREVLERDPGDASVRERVVSLMHPAAPAGEPETPALAEKEVQEPLGAERGAGEAESPSPGEAYPGPEAYGQPEGAPSPVEEAVGESEAGLAEAGVAYGERPGEEPAEPEAPPAFLEEAPSQPWEQGMISDLPAETQLEPTEELARADLLEANLSLEGIPLEDAEEYADLPPLEVSAEAEESREYADLPPLEPVLAEVPADEDVGLAVLEPLTFVEPDALEDEERAAAQERYVAGRMAEPSAPESGTGLVTETMAELYRSQGFHARAAEVYRSLLRERSEDERLQQRLAEVEAELAASTVAAGEAPDTDFFESAFTGAGGAAGGEETPYAWSAADEAGEGGVVIGDYFRTLLAWRGSAAAMPEPAVEPWSEPSEPDAPAEAGEELVLGPGDEAEGVEPGTARAEPEPAAESGWTPEELMREPAEPMPWDSTGEDAAPSAAAVPESDLMPWELPEPPGLEPAPEAAADAVAEPLAEEASAEEEAADEDEDLEMFRSWLQSLKK